ncbi:hypothetical protein GCM10023212_11100 [Luteolibacter yonseiensis]
MKTILIAALGLASSIHFVAADVTSKLIGTWSGKVTATSNGQAVVQNTTTVYKRYEKTGLIAVTTIKFSGQKIVGTSRYHKNGKVEGEMKVNGNVAAFITGRWSANNTTLSTSATAEGLFEPFKSTSKITLVSKKQLKIIGSTSTGERSVGSLKKK